MLVALDTAQLIHLCDSRTDTAVLREFRDTWNARSCTLALNTMTLREFVHGAGENLSQRQALLESFTSVRGLPNPNQLYSAEFGAHITALALDEPVRSYVDGILGYLRAFLFESLDHPSLIAAADRMRGISRNGREFDDVLAQSLDLMRVLGPMWPPKRLESMTKAEAIRTFEESTESYPEPLRTQQRERRVRLLDAYHSEPKNRRRFMRVCCDIEELEIARTAPYEDFYEIQHLKQRWFAQAARERLEARGLVRTPEHARSIMSKLSPYMLPGVSLRLAMLREQARDRTRVVESSDVADNVCLMFAPYVDLACVDKRVYQWVKRARSSKQRGLLLDEVGENLIDARNLAKVTEAIALHQLRLPKQ